MGLLDMLFSKVSKSRANRAASSGKPLVRVKFDWHEVRDEAMKQVENLFDPQYAHLSGDEKKKRATKAVAQYLDDGLVWRADLLGQLGEYLDGRIAGALLHAIAASNVQDAFNRLSR